MEKFANTLAAQALSLVDGLEVVCFVRSILHEMINGLIIPITCFTYNKSLSQNIHSTKFIYLRNVYLASIKESVSLGDGSIISYQIV